MARRRGRQLHQIGDDPCISFGRAERSQLRNRTLNPAVQDKPTQALKDGEIALLGIPWDENSSHVRGAADAPPVIRAAILADSSNMSAEDGTDLGAASRFVDVGDLSLGSGEVAADQITDGVRQVLTRGARALSLGGDHAVTYPVLRAYGPAHPGLTILHIDAHPDLYEDFGGNRLSHASPFARIMEEGLVDRLVQVGIRTMTTHQREQAARYGVEVIDMMHFGPEMDLRLSGPVYMSVDLDGLDPAFAPGVAHQEPGGLSTRDVLRLVYAIDGPLVGADIVELLPERDLGGMTAMLAAKLAKELVARMLR